MGTNNIVGIIGWPVSHSISPAMQNRAFLETGLASWSYIYMPVPKFPDTRVKEAVLGLRALGFRGANITVPHKETVLPYLDSISGLAKIIGAVNTIVVDGEGRLIGHNTDGPGFINDLADHGLRPADLRVIILGAGGSSRAITYMLLSHGCKNITICNRTKTKADSIANSFKDLFKDAVINTQILPKDADLIINTTSIGLSDTIDQMPWDENIKFSKDQVVYDVIYNPNMTTLLKHAAKNGAKTINGLGMLVHQGALAFEIWTGHKAPIEVMKKTASNALEQ